MNCRSERSEESHKTTTINQNAKTLYKIRH